MNKNSNVFVVDGISFNEDFKSQGCFIKSTKQNDFVLEEYKNFIVLKPVFTSSYHDSNPVVITTYYYFTNLERPELFRDKINLYCKQNNILGTILLGHEGVNSTICGLRKDIDNFYVFLSSMPEFQTIGRIEFKETYSNKSPFGKLKVRVKKEIVTFGGLCNTFDPGYYIAPEEWDDFIKKDEVILVDTRNDYEYDIGTFDGAVNPNVKNFREFAKWMQDHKEHVKDKKFAMFCTGGIRCERTTSYAKQLGLDNVYHLKGGIIGYFIETRNKNNAWIGKCFVFDDRVVLSGDLSN